MTKNEFIEKYGEEAYQRRLEQKKQYYHQHKEENRQYREQHREEIKQYNKQYKKQHREELLQYKKQYYQKHREELLQYKKQYNNQHIEEIKQYSRTNISMFAFCIPEEWEQIENYQLAKKDNFDGWCIHHRLETHNSDGQRRLINLSREELKALDMYYNRPANELVFLTNSEHTSLHRTKQHCSKE